MHTLSALEIQKLLAYRFDYIANTVLPNCYINGYEMDFAVITRAGYLIEVEIKRTLQDYYADKAKDKWTRLKCKQLYYCVPEALVEKVLPSLDERWGLMKVEVGGVYESSRSIAMVRKAKMIKGAKKLEDHEITYLTSKMVYRFWREVPYYKMKDVQFKQGDGI